MLPSRTGRKGARPTHRRDAAGTPAQVCPAGSYCPGGTTTPFPCPSFTESIEGVSSRADCTAVAGYYVALPGERSELRRPAGPRLGLMRAVRGGRGGPQARREAPARPGPTARPGARPRPRALPTRPRRRSPTSSRTASPSPATTLRRVPTLPPPPPPRPAPSSPRPAPATPPSAGPARIVLRRLPRQSLGPGSFAGYTNAPRTPPYPYPAFSLPHLGKFAVTRRTVRPVTPAAWPAARRHARDPVPGGLLLPGREHRPDAVPGQHRVAGRGQGRGGLCGRAGLLCQLGR